ncbi:hypothetical protein VDG1235_4363 [Verrucomicrobiia bacterium DG1235]|nr:hypothetical protein VDG1235_4363 [Verrucomicrobiae bacterium DG1235]
MREKVTDFFRDLYEKEHATKERINANLNFWLTLYSMQIGISVYYLRILENPYFILWHLFFYVPFALAWFFILKSVYSTAICFKGYKYELLGKPTDFLEYYSKGRSSAEDKEAFDIGFLENIEKQYAETANFNREVNRRRLNTNRNSIKNVFIGLSILILAFPCNIIIKAKTPSKNQKITVENPIKIKMSEDTEKSSQPAETTSQGPEPADNAPTPAPMEFPKPDFLYESIANSQREDPPEPINLPEPPESKEE